MPIKQPYRPPITKMPPITRQHEKREVKEDMGNPYEFWTRQGMRDGARFNEKTMQY